MTTAAVHTEQTLPAQARRDLDRLRDTTARVVGSVFFGTLLKTMRESPMKGPYGHGGRGEDVFMAQLHGVLAERAGSSAEYGLTDTLYARLKQQQQRISTQQPGMPGEA